MIAIYVANWKFCLMKSIGKGFLAIIYPFWNLPFSSWTKREFIFPIGVCHTGKYLLLMPRSRAMWYRIIVEQFGHLQAFVIIPDAMEHPFHPLPYIIRQERMQVPSLGFKIVPIMG